MIHVLAVCFTIFQVAFGDNHELLAANVGVNVNASPLFSFFNPNDAQSTSAPVSSGSQPNYALTSAQNFAFGSGQSYAPNTASYYSPMPGPPKMFYPKPLYPQMYSPAPVSHQMIHCPPCTTKICCPAPAPAPLAHNICYPSPPPPQCYCQFPQCPPMNTPEPAPAPEPVPSCCCPAGPTIINPQCPSIPKTEIFSCFSVPETNKTYPQQHCLPYCHEISKEPDQGKLMCVRHYTVKKIKPVYDEYVCKIPVIQNMVRHQPVTTVKTVSAIKRKVVMQPQDAICHSNSCQTKMAPPDPSICSNAMLGVPKHVLHHTSRPCIKYKPVIQETIVKIPVKQKVYRPVLVQRIVRVPVKTTVRRDLVETKIEKTQVPCECV